MRATTQAAMVDAVRLFVSAWTAHPTEDDWQAVAAAMTGAWELHLEDVERAAGGGFDGRHYNPAYDDNRLNVQLGRVWQCMADGHARTLSQIAAICDAPQASVSAQLRHLRKVRHGSWIIDCEPAADRTSGLFLYRMRNPDGTTLPPVSPIARVPQGASG